MLPFADSQLTASGLAECIRRVREARSIAALSDIAKTLVESHPDDPAIPTLLGVVAIRAIRIAGQNAKL